MGSASPIGGGGGISKQLSNAGLKVLSSDASGTPTNKGHSMQVGATPSSFMNNDPHQKENVGMPPQYPHAQALPPRHPAAAAKNQDPVFGGRVPRRDGVVSTNDSVGSLFGGGVGGENIQRRSGSAAG